jgi:hypothetical protein
MTKKSNASPASATNPPALRKRTPGLDPPPAMRLLTVEQIEQTHPALKGRIRAWIHRADASDPDFAGLRLAVVRVGRSIFVDEVRLREFLYQRSAMPPAPSRREGSRRAIKRVAA